MLAAGSIHCALAAPAPPDDPLAIVNAIYARVTVDGKAWSVRALLKDFFKY